MGLFLLFALLLSVECLGTQPLINAHQTTPSPEGRTLHLQKRQAPTDDKSYDQCSHPFHSFLCNPAPRPRTLTPVGAASFNVKQIAKPSAPFGVPSLDVKSIVTPDPSSNYFQRLTTPKPFTRPTEATIEEPSVVNCQQHTTYVKPPTTPKTTVILAENSREIQSKISPVQKLPPPKLSSPEPTFLKPQKLIPYVQVSTSKPVITQTPLPSANPKPSATFVQVQEVLPPNTKGNIPTVSSQLLIQKPQTQFLSGEAANSPELVIPKDNEVDNCKHSFHSFLCSQPSRSRRPFATPRAQPSPSLTGDSSFVSQSKILPPVSQPPRVFAPASQTPLRNVESQSQIQLNLCNDTSHRHTFIQRPTTTLQPRPPPPLTTTYAPIPQNIFAAAAQTSVSSVLLQERKQKPLCNDTLHIPSTTERIASLRSTTSYTPIQTNIFAAAAQTPVRAAVLQERKQQIDCNDTANKRTTTQTPATTRTTAPFDPAQPNIFLPAAQTPIKTVAPQENKQPHICNDAFHSFLCQPIDPSRRKQKYGEKYQGLNVDPSTTLTPLRGENSFIKQSVLIPNNQQQSTFKPSTTSTQLPPYFVSNAESPFLKSLIPCNHSYIATTNKPFTIQPINSSPILTPKADSSFNQPTRLPYPSTPSTTIRTTSSSQVRPLNIPAAQTPDVAVVRPDNDHGHGHGHGHGHDHDHHGIDICKDPFHSFLCIPVVPSKRKRPTGELPARFRNPVPPNLAGASSFNQPTKILPNNIKSAANNSPSPILTQNSFSTNRPVSTTRKSNIQPQPAQTFEVKQPSQAVRKTDTRNGSLCVHPFHSFLHNNTSVSGVKAVGITSVESASSLSTSKLEGSSTFLNPSNVLPLEGENTFNQNSGYVYNRPAKPFEYPSTSLRADSTITQQSKTFSSANLAGQNTQNQISSSGYIYPNSPSNQQIFTTKVPVYFTPTTHRPTTTNKIFYQGENNVGNSGYFYPKPAPIQQIGEQRPVTVTQSTTSPSGYYYPTPTISLQYPKPAQTPYISSLVGASSRNDPQRTNTKGSLFEQKEKVTSNSQVSSYPKHTGNQFYIEPKNLEINSNSKSQAELQSSSNYPSPTFRESVNKPRPSIDSSSNQNPPCDHTQHQESSRNPRQLSPPSPSDFVRGPSAAASVLAASNDLPEKCNHPFLGYKCKRSSEAQIRFTNK